MSKDVKKTEHFRMEEKRVSGSVGRREAAKNCSWSKQHTPSG